MESDYGFNIFSTSGTSGATNFPTNIFFATRGTTASPTAIQSGDVLGSLNWTGGYGAAFPTWITGAYIRGIAAENFSLTGAGTDLVFTTVAKTTITLSERMRISSQGNILIAGTAARGTTVGVGHLDLFNGTDPAGTLTNGISLYSSGGLFYSMNASGVRTAVGKAHTIFAPATTGSITLINNQHNLVNPAATIAVLTMVFPDSPVNNDTVTVKFTQIVTAITYTAGTGGATILSQVNGTVGGNYTWVYDSGNNTWY
jgi:hypothetical protein